MWDIVYFVKDTKTNEELKYSLRSLVNFPHKSVWFYGGGPRDLNPDFHIKVNQNQPTKSNHHPEPKITLCEAESFYEGEGSELR